jgi:hypothetical protein
MGVIMSRKIILDGLRFGRLVVAETIGTRVRAICDCGQTTETEKYSLKSGLTKSCGCLKNEGRPRTHGESPRGSWTPEYRAGVNMVTRCHNPKATRYKNWGGRGISVCDEWRHDYEAFLSHVGRRPSPTHSLDRIDNNRGYEPGNVRWATREQQARNTRKALSCR